MLLSIVPASDVLIYTMTEGTAIVGDSYTIICTVTKPAALLATPDITWISPSGHTEIDNVTQTGNATVVSVTAQFSPLLASHNGIYTCKVSLMSPSFLTPLNLTSIIRVSIQSKLYK